MITTTGKARAQAVSVDGGPPIAVLDHCKVEYRMNGHDYVVRRQGILARTFELWRGEEMLASAEGESVRERYTVHSAGRQWMLLKEGLATRRFGLLDGDRRVGEIKWAGRWFHMDIVADLPSDMPLETQVFLTWLALFRMGDS